MGKLISYLALFLMLYVYIVIFLFASDYYFGLLSLLTGWIGDLFHLYSLDVALFWFISLLLTGLVLLFLHAYFRAKMGILAIYLTSAFFSGIILLFSLTRIPIIFPMLYGKYINIFYNGRRYIGEDGSAQGVGYLLLSVFLSFFVTNAISCIIYRKRH